ncbi:MAG: hypothetical protein K2I01_07030, partial [Lachnospiraceae bacterium]|nr:hypothetical protein [Lachnospiraceae bacterium]
MIRIEQIKLRIGQESGLLYGEAAKILRIAEQEILSLHMVKRSLDARKKPDLFYSYIIDVEMKKEAAVWKRLAKGRSGRIAAGKHFLSLQQ